MKPLSLKTGSHSELIDITARVRKVIGESRWNDGVITVFIPHTTAGVTIQENADPDVKHDFLKDLERLIPWEQPYYKHAEGNSAAHLKSSMMGSSARVILSGGELQLGQWQGIYFCEFDGPRNREVWIEFTPSA